MDRGSELAQGQETEQFLENSSFVVAHAYTEARIMNMLGWNKRTPEDVDGYIDQIADGFNPREEGAMTERTRQLKIVIRKSGDVWNKYQPFFRGEQTRHLFHIKDRAAKQLLTDLAIARAPLPPGYIENNVSSAGFGEWGNNIEQEVRKLAGELGFNEATWRKGSENIDAQRVMKGVLSGKVHLPPRQPQR